MIINFSCQIQQITRKSLHANHPLILFKDKEDNSNPINSYFSSQFPSLPLHAKCTKYKWRDRLVNSPFHSNFVKSNTIKTSKDMIIFTHHPHHTHSSLPPPPSLSALSLSLSAFSREPPLPIFLHFSIKLLLFIQVNVISHTMIIHISKSFEQKV